MLGIITLSDDQLWVRPVSLDHEQLIASFGDLAKARRRGRRRPLLLPLDKAQSKAVKEFDLVRFKPAQKSTRKAQHGKSGRKHGPISLNLLETIANLARPVDYDHLDAALHAWPDQFSSAAHSECKTYCVPKISAIHKDLRHLPFVTIDGVDARDFDDAVYGEVPISQTAPAFLWVAVADVAWYVRPGSLVDREAFDRGNSLYFSARCLPMLPETLSNDLCSLKPGADRAALVIRLAIMEDGSIGESRFMRAIIRSRHRLTYEQAEQMLEGTKRSSADPDSGSVLLTQLDHIITRTMRARLKRGALGLDSPELVIRFDGKGYPDHVSKRMRLKSHMLIEEAMIAANVAAARVLTDDREAAIYRVHDHPPAERLQRLWDQLKALHFQVPEPSADVHKSFQTVLDRAYDCNMAGEYSLLVMQAQAQAVYDIRETGHFGLALAQYTHCTSPIRRYSDLLVHRFLIRRFGLEEDTTSPTKPERLQSIAEHLSSRERIAILAERHNLERLAICWAQRRIGQHFTGRVIGLVKFGAFIRFDDAPVEGLVHVRTMPWDSYRLTGHSTCLAGYKSGFCLRLFEAVTVEIIEGSWIDRRLDLKLIEGGQVSARKRSRHRQSARKATPKAGRRRGRWKARLDQNMVSGR
ncbi:MAG: VacB/RNase II family 3'-5' exoribonuclease [Pseudomonadota bacterium]